MLVSRADPLAWVRRWGRALIGRELAARQTPWIVATAAALVTIELVAVWLSGWMGPLVPLGGLALALFAVLCWISLPVGWLVTLAGVGFSREVFFPGLSSALWVPTEPLIFTFLAVWIVKSLLAGAHRMPRSPVLHMIGLIGLIATLSAIQSRFPTLSFKAVVSASWFAAFGFLFPFLEGARRDFLRKAAWVLGVATLFFSLYGLFFVARMGIARWTGNAMGRPFFPEHGTYSTFLSFGLAMILGLTLSAREAWVRWAGAISACLVTLAIVLSLARAAYLGLAGLLGVMLFYLLRTRRARTALVMVASLSVVGFGVAKFRAAEFVGLYASSIAQPGELSNLERISRWLAAWNMVRAHPVLGVGYGAYEDSYYSYRVLTLRTQERFRRMGVHSEYFEALSEMGWVGFSAVLLFIFVLARQADRVIRGSPDPRTKYLALAALGGVTTYVVHGFFNNYSGADKFDVPFWLLVATIAVLSRRHAEEIASPSPARPA